MVDVKDIVLEAGPSRLAATKYVSESLNRVDQDDSTAQAFSGD